MADENLPYWATSKAKPTPILNPLDQKIDLKWAGTSSDSDTRFSNYYDYYFSGEDVKVFIDGLFDPEDELDLASFAYSVRQEKQPLYGFWSYNYDAVMYGTRIISGEFSIYTRYPRRMTEFLERAAKSRATNPTERNRGNSIVSKLYSSFDSSEDEANIQKYWNYSQLDRITLDPAGSSSENNIFSAHPPFNFVILYGVEETALSPVNALKSETYLIEDSFDRMIYSDVNERKVRIDNSTNPMKIILQQVQLMSMSTGYSPGGQPLVESYQFMARDYYFSQTDLGFIKSMQTRNISDSDKPTTDPTSSASTGFGNKK